MTKTKESLRLAGRFFCLCAKPTKNRWEGENPGGFCCFDRKCRMFLQKMQEQMVLIAKYAGRTCKNEELLFFCEIIFSAQMPNESSKKFENKEKMTNIRKI